MTRAIVNPWTWQDQFGFVQGNEISGAKRMLFCAGIVSVDDDGNLLHAGDMAGQIDRIFDNIGTVLEQAGMGLSDIVRMTYYTTDVAAFTENGAVLMNRLQKGSCRPATTLLGVAALFHPDCVVEIEATAVV